ncbi:MULTISPECIES: bifunctional phosphopantothenoylcysteine decarboxylase/phosphopantothenate--cysteine ligase CoaBC [Jonquetella]|uniref:Coenzyme A biosynthesis bifunctional protein CoaBC n=1 Tax=Jonquetella anthropi DSM 22815 TaxID=885272 RepID=H0UL03_9BACT|nr:MULTISPECIES: bifunctional phosphopantothenoylcysteine decarboxylase/phosphopantothenate--cysteine ligase CoaBC [Jonquetella]EEX47922.1 phosphopantothenoylcysteine decarboxylase/phosphopantothenate--cysteine ligase [Jonquetella anthropi E3_33 E1]EHM13362.1 phosphopantothenoylcysteine decarboxylase/phosphopantothenate--cysteine ligase [Jonquetella anthropi DSM 22815]ERL24905.1 phosphopantothenoylcysteine decarboxylase/phosphopantothenate--cysteine ligase [Jonquetella sp. BV3C21]
MVPLQWQSNRRIVLAVTGGIAAYKTPGLVRLLASYGCQVRVVMTQAAESFVSPMVLETLSGNRVWRQSDFLSVSGGSQIPHIQLAQWAEAVIVAPCTAHHLAAAAVGLGDSLVAATLLATKAPVLFFPAMNSQMLAHPATEENIRTLARRGAFVAGAENGPLACGEEGPGRMPEPEEIVRQLWRVLSPASDLAGRRVLITAGPTREYLDPVRFISNPSTGKMGAALAWTAVLRGASVEVVAGPTSVQFPKEASVTRVVSALEMFQAVKDRAASADFIVASAAVSDYRPESSSPRKIKRESVERVERAFVQNPDIIAWAGANKRPGQILVGFAAETDDVLVHAQGKLERKKLDFIAANDLTSAGSGFGADTNTVTLLDRSGGRIELKGSKEAVAWEMWNVLSPTLA